MIKKFCCANNRILLFLAQSFLRYPKYILQYNIIFITLHSSEYKITERLDVDLSYKKKNSKVTEKKIIRDCNYQYKVSYIHIM